MTNTQRLALIGLGLVIAAIAATALAVSWRRSAPGEQASAPAPRQWEAPPPMEIDPGKIYGARLVTEKGEIVVELLAKQAPMTVNNFVFLARQGFYDGTTFHRVIPGFMAQGGDPTGTGAGGPGYQFPDEISPELRFDGPGYVAMANAGPNTNGSQFFITYAATPWLDGRHTIFGKVVAGMDVALSLTPRDPQQATEPGDRLERVSIEEWESSRLPPPTPTPEPRAPALDPTARRWLAEVPIPLRDGYFTLPPEMQIDPTQRYTATLRLADGDIVIAMDAEKAPQSVNNFVVLARLGYFDGLTFHRVEPGVLIQGGDPQGTGRGGPGYDLPAEIGLPHTAGAVAYARLPDAVNPERRSSGSQFYITLIDLPQLDGGYTVFGYVVEGLDVAGRVRPGAIIETIEIEEIQRNSP